ncbi:hypothetical protein Memar_1452 [Methanoculleus marisnigri JR1]|uniref:Uncharacterized protein n=1 Tax=Methanoculleus marisnigri (strain ATCC 35101 / DSM 1498 / JR1) TaxID=368407 RepID=A3CVI1_METMJ|nr:hypothetical protein Memar_1452 [Methanoculleus marisnigri JR1]
MPATPAVPWGAGAAVTYRRRTRARADPEIQAIVLNNSPYPFPGRYFGEAFPRLDETDIIEKWG